MQISDASLNNNIVFIDKHMYTDEQSSHAGELYYQNTLLLELTDEFTFIIIFPHCNNISHHAMLMQGILPGNYSLVNIFPQESAACNM